VNLAAKKIAARRLKRRKREEQEWGRSLRFERLSRFDLLRFLGLSLLRVLSLFAAIRYDATPL